MESKDYNEQTQEAAFILTEDARDGVDRKITTDSILHRSLPNADKLRGVPFPRIVKFQITQLLHRFIAAWGMHETLWAPL